MLRLETYDLKGSSFAGHSSGELSRLSLLEVLPCCKDRERVTLKYFMKKDSHEI